MARYIVSRIGQMIITRKEIVGLKEMGPTIQMSLLQIMMMIVYMILDFAIEQILYGILKKLI